MADSIFHKEKQIADAMEQVLEEEPIHLENFAIAAPLASLLAHYRKLIRQTEMMMEATDKRMGVLLKDRAELKEYADELKHYAEHDLLTGLLNKGAVTQYVTQHLADADLCIILFDIDHFKRVNDTHGHYVGDLVLTAIGELLRDAIKDCAYLGRFGGEEFMIATTEELEGAADIAEGLRAMIQGTPLVDDGRLILNVTVSMGVAPAAAGEGFDAIYKRADRLLYAAKHNGRNRVEVWRKQ
jgi:diguanylate cyclase (GGDEF)-like protein